MVTIITGSINSGKTTFVKDIYEKTKTGDGFVSIKIMSGNKVKGFDVLQLSTGDKQSFIRIVGSEPLGWAENCRIGQYTVSENAVNWVAGHIEELIRNEISPIFLDEVGDLEIDGKCFFMSLKRMVESGLDLYLSVRDKNLVSIIDGFGINNAKIIKMGERYA